MGVLESMAPAGGLPTQGPRERPDLGRDKLGLIVNEPSHSLCVVEVDPDDVATRSRLKPASTQALQQVHVGAAPGAGQREDRGRRRDHELTGCRNHPPINSGSPRWISSSLAMSRWTLLSVPPETIPIRYRWERASSEAKSYPSSQRTRSRPSRLPRPPAPSPRRLDQPSPVMMGGAFEHQIRCCRSASGDPVGQLARATFSSFPTAGPSRLLVYDAVSPVEAVSSAKFRRSPLGAHSL